MAAMRLANTVWIVDKFHAVGHTDAFCKAHCDPSLPQHAERLQNVRTSVAEFTFTWLSAYKHQTKHMCRHGFMFFLLEMIESHNQHIFKDHGKGCQDCVCSAEMGVGAPRS